MTNEETDRLQQILGNKRSTNKFSSDKCLENAIRIIIKTDSFEPTHHITLTKNKLESDIRDLNNLYWNGLVGTENSILRLSNEIQNSAIALSKQYNEFMERQESERMSADRFRVTQRDAYIFCAVGLIGGCLGYWLGNTSTKVDCTPVQQELNQFIERK